MKANYLLNSQNAEALYEAVKSLPVIDFHNHLSAKDIATDKRYDDICELWLTSDPYKHRLMRICGVEERLITGDCAPKEKFKEFCRVFPYLAGNPVYDWSRMELSSVFGIEELPCRDNAELIYDKTKEMLASDEYSLRGILSRFNVEYQSPVATLTEDISAFDGVGVAPSLRGDDLLSPSDELKTRLMEMTGIDTHNEDGYIRAVCLVMKGFESKGCRFADHSLDSGFFADGDRVRMLIRLGEEYSRRGWTLLLHVGAKRDTSPRLKAVAGPAGGYAAAGEGFEISKLCNMLANMEADGELPDTVLFPLNMNDQAPFAILQGSFAEDGHPSKLQLGPAWWWCDHVEGITDVLEKNAAYGVLSTFVGMTTDSRSLLSFVRHDYFRRILCRWTAEKVAAGEFPDDAGLLRPILENICYVNSKGMTT